MPRSTAATTATIRAAGPPGPCHWQPRGRRVEHVRRRRIRFSLRSSDRRSNCRSAIYLCERQRIQRERLAGPDADRVELRQFAPEQRGIPNLLPMANWKGPVRALTQSGLGTENLYSALPITGCFAGIPGSSSTFFGPSEGHDSAVISAGVSAQLAPAVTIYVLGMHLTPPGTKSSDL